MAENDSNLMKNINLHPLCVCIVAQNLAELSPAVIWFWASWTVPLVIFFFPFVVDFFLLFFLMTLQYAYLTYHYLLLQVNTT